MEGDNGKNAAGVEAGFRRGKRLTDFIEFFVNLDADGLKAARGRIDLAGFRARHDGTDNIGELQGAGDRGFFACCADRPGDASGGAFFTVITQDTLKPLRAGCVDKITGIRPVAFHPHVKRAIVLERKATLGRINLGGG